MIVDVDLTFYIYWILFGFMVRKKRQNITLRLVLEYYVSHLR